MVLLRRNWRRGFTLIELMIVVAIIGILAAIAVPKFADLIRKSGEGASKGNLGTLRSSLSIYFGDMEGQYPALMAALTIGGKYQSSIQNARIPSYHPDSSAENDGTLSAASDLGGWWYDNIASDVNAGQMMVACTHTDTKGNIWTTY
jgi:general secretion pathway protein G